MKEAYPIVISPADGGYIVYIPDFDINTEGNSLTDAIEMARDAIGQSAGTSRFLHGSTMKPRKAA